MFLAPASEVQQICDSQPEAASLAREERDEGVFRLGRKRRLLVQHLSILQAQVQRRQSCRRRQGKSFHFIL